MKAAPNLEGITLEMTLDYCDMEEKILGYYDMRVKVKFCWVSMDYCDMREPQLVLKT